jgi:hypothetical protein
MQRIVMFGDNKVFRCQICESIDSRWQELCEKRVASSRHSCKFHNHIQTTNEKEL